MDSAEIQEKDVEWHNEKILRKRRKDYSQIRKPLYTVKDVIPAMGQFVSFPYDQWIGIHQDVKIIFKDAGHILGSASVTLQIKESGKTSTIGFTADIGRPDRPILRNPQPMPESDYVICESTYGDRVHESTPEQSEHFLNIIKRTCIEKKGKLIIPAFSLGRTQEIVYMLDRMENAGILPRIPIYVDSPLATNVTNIFGLHPECFDEELLRYIQKDNNPFGFNNLTYIRDVEESKSLNDTQEPCIIISASGMMNAGRVKHHLANNIENPKNTFLIVGYCTPDTPGGILRSGAKTIQVFDEEKVVRAEIEIMDSFSAHGDKNEMFDFIKNQLLTVKKVFLVHGEYETQKQFRGFLNAKGFVDVEIPESGQEFTLN